MLHFLGGAKWHNDQQKTSLSFMVNVGPQLSNSTPNAAEDNQFLYSLVFKKRFSEKLLYAFEQTLGGTQEGRQSSLFPA